MYTVSDLRRDLAAIDGSREVFVDVRGEPAKVVALDFRRPSMVVIEVDCGGIDIPELERAYEKLQDIKNIIEE